MPTWRLWDDFLGADMATLERLFGADMVTLERLFGADMATLERLFASFGGQKSAS